MTLIEKITNLIKKIYKSFHFPITFDDEWKNHQHYYDPFSDPKAKIPNPKETIERDE